MNLKQAKQKVVTTRVVGVAISVPALVSTVISLLKMIYLRIDDGTQLGSTIARPIQALVSLVYENTERFLGWFWEHSPTPDPMHLTKLENGYFLAIYLLIFLGMALFSSGNKLARRLNDINQKVEDQTIMESIRGSEARTREQIENEVEIPPSSIFSQFHQLYLAPIVVGIIIALSLKFLGI